jgi:hypothetical protein
VYSSKNCDFKNKNKIGRKMIYTKNSNMRRWMNILNMLPPDQSQNNLKALKFISETW